MLPAMRERLLPWVLAWSLCGPALVLAQETAKPSATEAAPKAAEPPPPAATPNTPEPPPRPPKDGDFAGQAPAATTTGNTAASAKAGAPQEDFAEADAQEYHKHKPREFSVRVDMLNWLLLGRFRVELEATVWKFISVQLVPVFVTTQSPIALNYAGLDDPLTQHSNGLGPISGVSIGAAVWLSGEPFQGYALRLEFENYGYEYRSTDAQGVFDHVTFTERRLIAFFGSHSRFGAFTFAGGFGLGYELNQVERCDLTIVTTDGVDSIVAGSTSHCQGHQFIALDRQLHNRADLNGPLHPVYFQARFTLGVVF
jgi:hypothetical protein